MWSMIALSVAKLKMFSLESDIFLWIKPKQKKNFFVESLDQCRRLEVREKARKFLFFVMSLRLSDHKVLHNIASTDFARILSRFSLAVRTSNFWSLRNLIKQLFHLRLLDTILVIANSALRASLAIYHLISNARSWNKYILLDGLTYNTRGYFA